MYVVCSLLKVCVGTGLLFWDDSRLLSLSVASVHTQLDGDVDCFSMTAVIWVVGWTVFNAPPAIFRGKYHLTPCNPAAGLWNKCSLPHYLLSHKHCSQWEQHLKPHSGGNNMLALCVSASVDHAGTGFLHWILLFSHLHLFSLQLPLWVYDFHISVFANSVSEKRVIVQLFSLFYHN